MVRVHWPWSSAVGAGVVTLGLLLGAVLFDEVVPTVVFALGALVASTYGVARLGVVFEVTDAGLTRVVWGRRTAVPWSELQAWFCMRQGDGVRTVQRVHATWLELSGPFGTWRVWPEMTRYGDLVEALTAHGSLRTQLRPKTGYDRWLRRGGTVARGGAPVLGAGFLAASCAAVGYGAAHLSGVEAHTPTVTIVAGTALAGWFVGALLLSLALGRNLFLAPARVTVRGAFVVLIVGCVAWGINGAAQLEWGTTLAAGIIGAFLLYELLTHDTSD